MDSGLTKIHTCIIEFLKKNGGMPNGYSTQIIGIIRQRSGEITWTTPEMDELTIRKVRQIGNHLVEQIQEIMQEFRIELIRITSEHIESGCYDIFIEQPHIIRVDRWVMLRERVK